jgi:hypothetical protein
MTMDLHRELFGNDGMLAEVVTERDEARRERDEAMAKLAEYKAYAFGTGLLKYCGVDDLPFLVRCAMGQAVRQIFLEWQAAGSPSDVETLKALFRGRS